MGFRLGFLLFAIFFFVLFMIASIFNHNHKWQEKYNLRNHFPYELNYGMKFSENIYGNISLIACSLLLSAFFVTMDLRFIRDFFIPIIIAGVLASLMIPVIVFVPVSKMKAHIVALLLQILTGILLPGTIGIAALRIYQDEGSNPLAIVVLVCCIVVALAIVVIMFNPKLSLRMEPEIIEKENGEKEYKRPKSIPLAFTEWLFIFSTLLSSILLFILLIIC